MLTPIIIAAVALATTYLYKRLHYKRFEQHGCLPQHHPSLILGHLKKLDAIIKSGPADRHPGMPFIQV
jgi:hypothetical protein